MKRTIIKGVLADKQMTDKWFSDQIDEYSINRIIETCNHVEDGEEPTILVKELR